MQSIRILVINPGSTSTKISVFDSENEVFTQSLFHDAPLLQSFGDVNNQLEFRLGVIQDFLRQNSIQESSIDVFVGRGGSAQPQRSGVMEITQRLYEDTVNAVGGSQHPAKLGVMLAYTLARRNNRKAYTLDATNVDELCDLARITGIKGIYRKAQTHVLNQKAISRIHAQSIGKNYEDCNFIVCHIDGGITVTAHCKGKMIDSTEGAGGDGPFSPTRVGSVPVLHIIEDLRNESITDLEARCSRSGGFASHFGTSDADKVHRMIEDGDSYAALVWDAMTYQIAKSIGEMACVLKGQVDAIILTGGLVRFDRIVDMIKEHCSWIAPVSVYPGEVEQEAMALSVLEVLEGKKEALHYTARPVFEGF